MKAYKLEVLVVDFDGIGPDEMALVFENAKYPNHCIGPKVVRFHEKDLGEWSDDHPLNKLNGWQDYFANIEWKLCF